MLVNKYERILLWDSRVQFLCKNATNNKNLFSDGLYSAVMGVTCTPFQSLLRTYYRQISPSYSRGHKSRILPADGLSWPSHSKILLLFLSNIRNSKKCPFYRVPERDRCHGMSRRMQDSYATNLLYSGTLYLGQPHLTRDVFLILSSTPLTVITVTIFRRITGECVSILIARNKFNDSKSVFSKLCCSRTPFGSEK
jgi:hypothetical protein